LYYFSNLKPRAILSIGGLLIIAALAAFLIPRFFLHHSMRGSFYFENALYFEKSLWLRLGTAMLSLLFYLRILFYPYPLLYYYGYNMIPLTSLASTLVQLSVLIYAILLLYSLVNIRSKTVPSFAVLWYLIAIFMYSNLLLPVTGVVAERFIFLASLGFVMVVVFIIFKLFGTEPKSLTIELDSRIKIISLVIAILIPWGLVTVNRNTAWRDMVSLFRKDIPHLRQSAKANYQYAEYLLNTVYVDEDYRRYGMVDKDMRENIRTHLGFSLKVYPKGYNTLNDFGNFFLLIENRYDSAVYYFHRAVEVDSTLTPGWISLGMTYRQMGQYSQAMNCYQKVLRMDPGNSRACFSLADLYYDLGDINRSLYYSDLGQKASGKK
jgi:tetratricopeptide (TPR) repeat protein